MNKDTIYREDAIEAVENVTWYHQNRNKDMVEGANSDEHQAWYKSQDIYEALEAVPSADRPQEWIPCSERLPEKEGYYLVTTRRFAFCDTIYKTRPAFRSSTNRWVRVGGSEVLAWMPLPKPWKGADDED